MVKDFNPKRNRREPIVRVPISIKAVLDTDASDETVGRMVRAATYLFRSEMRTLDGVEYRCPDAPEWPSDLVFQAQRVGFTPEEWIGLRFYWHSFRDEVLEQVERMKALARKNGHSGAKHGKGDSVEEEEENLEGGN